MSLGVVAVVPFWSQAGNLNADSNFAYLRSAMPEFERQTENTVFLILFPDPKYGVGQWVYTPDDFQSDRVKLFPWPYDTQMSTGTVMFDAVRWKRFEDAYAPTQYWLHQVETGAVIRGGYARNYNRNAKASMVAQHHYIIHESLPYPIESQFPRRWAQMGGSIGADVVVFNSNHCRNMARESFAEFLNPDIMTALELKSETVPFGLLAGDEYQPGTTPPDVPVILYNHRFEGYKRSDLTFRVFDDLRRDPDVPEFEVWVTQVAGQPTGGKKQHHFDRVVFAPKRRDYYANISVPAINTINSTHETFCIAMVDSMAVGHIIVAPNAVTFPELVPDGYPYLFNNSREQRAMLAEILEGWPGVWHHWSDQLRQHANDRFRVDDYVAKYVPQMYRAEQPYRAVVPKPETLAKMHAVFDGMNPGEPYAPKRLQRAFADLGLGGQAVNTKRIVRDAVVHRGDIDIKLANGTMLVRKSENQ